MNTNQMHFNRPFAERTEFGQPLVVSSLTLAIVLGSRSPTRARMRPRTSGWDEIKLPLPVVAGDTLWAESEVLSARESRSRPNCGIVKIRTRGVNQRAEVVIEFTRSFMIFKRTAPEVEAGFPATDTPWTVGGETG